MGADFSCVHAVSSVVARAVGDRGDEGVRLAEEVEDAADEVSVGDLPVAADVVDFSVLSFLEDEVDGPAVVFYVEPVPHVFSIAVEGDGAVLEGPFDGEGDELFGVLEGAVVIAAPGDGDGDAVGPAVSEGEEVGAGLGAAVGGMGVQGGLFGEEEVRTVQGEVAVDLVGGDLVEPADTAGPAAV